MVIDTHAWIYQHFTNMWSVETYRVCDNEHLRMSYDRKTIGRVSPGKQEGQ